LVQHFVKFHKDLCRRILGVFWLPKEPPTDLQNVAIVSRVDCAQNFGREWLWLVQGCIELRFFRE
jgi:hypothetical protein